MDKSKNWKYYFSHSLNLEYAIHKEKNIMCVKDPDGENGKVFYEEKELALLEEKQIDPRLHILKTMFQGEIVQYQEVNNVD